MRHGGAHEHGYLSGLRPALSDHSGINEPNDRGISRMGQYLALFVCGSKRPVLPFRSAGRNSQFDGWGGLNMLRLRYPHLASLGWE